MASSTHIERPVWVQVPAIIKAPCLQTSRNRDTDFYQAPRSFSSNTYIASEYFPHLHTYLFMYRVYVFSFWDKKIALIHLSV